jgi:glycogen debranching enzyme
LTAYSKVFGHHAHASQQLWQFMRPFTEHIKEGLLGSISQAFDGNRPHHTFGCPAYALSVAELSRALVEEIGTIKDDNPKTIDDIIAQENTR